MAINRSDHGDILQLRRAFDDEVYGPIQACGSDPKHEGYDFGMIIRDAHLDVDRVCVLNTKILKPEEANWLAICREGLWVTASLQRTPGSVFIVEGLRIAKKVGQKSKPEDMRLVFNRRVA